MSSSPDTPASGAERPRRSGLDFPDTFPTHVTVLSGGVGGARFLQGLLHLAARHGASPRISVVTNTADDWWLHGLKVCPDLDTVMYTLGDGIDVERGWGRRDETWNARDELAAYGVGPAWFGLGDRDLATHLVRTQMLDAGYPLSAVTTALCRRWEPGVELLPMTDDRVETHVVVDDPDTGEQRAVHFQEYWVRHHAEVPAHAVVPIGIEDATPAPGVLDAIAQADVVLVPPSNPVVSVGTILGVPGIREALASTPAPVVGVSGIIGKDHVRGMARQLLGVVGVEVSAAGVAEHYGARSRPAEPGRPGVLDGWLVDEVDAPALPRIEAAGIAARAVPLWMTDADATADLVGEALGLASQVATGTAAGRAGTDA
ncbi:2-phospho-L-lactate transferase [Nocardioides scoriae]|uniref:2-phospho-L-lactate transferase n=1 Tax=Nocardioides scoriae TaxID=642780 RepID=UPI000B878B96|nr:2-phospho-L-lactate transferase [Nocardioides scoriae]